MIEFLRSFFEGFAVAQQDAINGVTVADDEMAFERAFERAIGHEGGFQNDRNDRGNWTTGVIGQGELRGTKYGVSAMSYPDLDIRNLTLDQARDIYFEDFWLRARCNEMPPALAFQVFDAAINHGIGNAVRFLQRALGVADDGALGPITMGALAKADETAITLRFIAERATFFTRLSTFDRFGRGWIRTRVADNLTLAAEDLV